MYGIRLAAVALSTAHAAHVLFETEAKKGNSFWQEVTKAVTDNLPEDNTEWLTDGDGPIELKIDTVE